LQVAQSGTSHQWIPMMDCRYSLTCKAHRRPRAALALSYDAEERYLLAKYGTPTDSHSASGRQHSPADLRLRVALPLGSLPERRAQHARAAPPNSIWNLVLSPEGKLLTVCNAWGRIDLWNLAAKQCDTTLTNEGSFRAVAFSGDGRFLAFADLDRGHQPVVRFWDVVARRAAWDVALDSHGLPASRTWGTSNGEDLASHGYVVVAIDHSDCWATEFPDGRYLAGNHSGDVPGRLKDMTFLLDKLVELNAADPLFEGRLDLERIGVSGGSFGGMVVTFPVRSSSSRCFGPLEPVPECLDRESAQGSL
jgi:hypothetical protein